jgi:hypothetical protein
MSEYFFGLHAGHLTAKADRIAKRHGAAHSNHTEANGQRGGWFSCTNRGQPFDGAVADAVYRDIDAVGGIDALRCARDKEGGNRKRKGNHTW